MCGRAGASDSRAVVHDPSLALRREPRRLLLGGQVGPIEAACASAFYEAYKDARAPKSGGGTAGTAVFHVEAADAERGRAGEARRLQAEGWACCCVAVAAVEGVSMRRPAPHAPCSVH